MALFLDHVYTADRNHGFLKKLKRMGFVEIAKPTRHPGGDICRFLMFPSANSRGRAYLEFIHGIKKIPHCAGMSFGVTGSLARFHGDLERGRRLRSSLVHRNYDWSQGRNREHRPGWNFLSFKGLGFYSFYPWITEYEFSAARPKKTKATANNGVTGIEGFEFEIHPRGKRFFESLLKRKIGSSVRLSCGTRLYFADGQRTRLRNVILKSRGRWRDGLESAEFRGRPAGRIANPNPRMWNILIV